MQMSGTSDAAGARMGLAYLVSQYPAVNHTYILREIRELCRLGLDIKVASVSAPDRPPANLTAEESRDAERTFYIKRQGIALAFLAHTAAVFRNPASYFRGLGFAFRVDFGSLRSTFGNLLYLTEALILARWVRSHRITHVHVHFSSTVGLFLKRVFPNCGVSMSIHGPAEFHNALAFHLREKIAACTFVRAISDYGRSQLMVASDYSQWSKIAVCRLGVDPESLTARPFRPNPETFEILNVAQLVPVKGQHILLEVITLLTRQGRSVRLRLVGGGPDRSGLEEHACRLGISASLIFDGVLNQDEVRERFRDADIFALPSFAEGIPVVLMEAMSMEIPCVATCITGIPELIRDGIDGLLVPPSDAGKMAEAIGRLMDDSALRESLGRAGRRTIIERYDLRANVVHLADVFRERLSAD